MCTRLDNNVMTSKLKALMNLDISEDYDRNNSLLNATMNNSLNENNGTPRFSLATIENSFAYSTSFSEKNLLSMFFVKYLRINFD